MATVVEGNDPKFTREIAVILQRPAKLALRPAMQQDDRLRGRMALFPHIKNDTTTAFNHVFGKSRCHSLPPSLTVQDLSTRPARSSAGAVRDSPQNASMSDSLAVR